MLPLAWVALFVRVGMQRGDDSALVSLAASVSRDALKELQRWSGAINSTPAWQTFVF